MDFSQVSAVALAYLGDSVIEILVREHLILKGYEKSGKLSFPRKNLQKNHNKLFIFYVKYDKIVLLSSLKKVKLNNTYEKKQQIIAFLKSINVTTYIGGIYVKFKNGFYCK